MIFLLGMTLTMLCLWNEGRVPDNPQPI